jgi:serine/threonine protein kinase
MYCTRCGASANINGTSTSGIRFCTRCGFELKTVSAQAQIELNSRKQTLKENYQEQPADSPADPLVGKIIDHRYYLESLLGIGGMGVVYRAKRLHIGDIVAIKILNSDHTADTRAVERFHREAKVGARLKHTNAVTVYDFGVSEDKLIYFVMELVEGEDLRRIIVKTGQMTQTAAAEILAQVCAALDEAHRKGVVHRDLKPENILVQSTPSGPRVKVLDFGIASLRKLTVDKLTQTGSIVGTPHYMSPEQCLGEEVDGRSDIYSLGIILYEMLSGTVPFDSTTPTAIAIQQVNKVPPSLRELNPNVSPQVEAVVMHALMKWPKERPQTAAAFAQELLAAVENDQPTLIQQSPVIEQSSGLTLSTKTLPRRKNKKLIPLAIGLVLLVAVASGFGVRRYIKNQENGQQPASPFITGNVQAADQSSQLKVDQQENPLPEEPDQKPTPTPTPKPSVPAVKPPVKKKAVVTRKKVAPPRKVTAKKEDDSEDDDHKYRRDRRMSDDDYRYRRYRYNSFRPDDRDRYFWRRRHRWFD